MSVLTRQRAFPCLVGAAVVLVGVGAGAADPPVVTKVDPAVKARLAALGEEADRLMAEGKFAAAARPAGEAAALTAKTYGAKHWLTFDAERRAELSKQGKALPNDKAAALAAALTAERKGIQFQDEKNLKAAEEAFREAAEGFIEAASKDTPESARALHAAGRTPLTEGRFASARSMYTTAVAVRRKVLPADHPDIGRSLFNLAVAQKLSGNLEEARTNYGLAADLWRTCPDRDEEKLILAVLNVGHAAYDTQDYGAARDYYREGLELRRRAVPIDRVQLAKAHDHLGMALRRLEDFTGARDNHRAALAIFREEFPDPDPTVALCLNCLGLVQIDLHDFDGALESLLEAYEIRRKTLAPKHPRLAEVQDNIGTVKTLRGDPVTAQRYHERALEIFRANPGHPGVITCLHGLGLAQFEQGLYPQAKKSFADALGHPLAGRVLDPTTAFVIQTNLGSAQCLLGEYDAGRTSLLKALDGRRGRLPPGHREIVQSLSNIALWDVVRGRVTDQTRAFLTEALAGERKVQSALAGAQAEAEQLVVAAHARRLLSTYLNAARAPGSDLTPNDIYDQAVRLKGLVTARQRWLRELRAEADPAVLDELLRVSGSLSRVAPVGAGQVADPAGMKRLDARRKELERQLAGGKGFARYQTKLDRGRDAVRAALPADACLIDFVEYLHPGPPLPGGQGPKAEVRLLAFVVRPGAEPVRLVELGPVERVEKLVLDWRARHADPKGAPAGPDPAAELRKVVWEPLQGLIGQPKVVLVSPTGPLTLLPFAALPGRNPNTYLLHEFAFATVPTLILLPDVVAERPARPARPAALVVGGIDYGVKAAPTPGDTPWVQLKATGPEADAVGTQFGKAFPAAPAATVLTGAGATKAAVLKELAARRSFVHVATHGFFAAGAEPKRVPGDGLGRLRFDQTTADRYPSLRSGLVLAGANAPPNGKLEECLLTALEVSELNLSGTELVMLSACVSGRGTAVEGEGVLGLQRAFGVAGARSVVASLWEVPDKATRLLTEEFYRQLWSAPVSRAEALRRAQLRVLGATRDPKTGELRAGETEPEEPRPVVPEPRQGAGMPPLFWAAFVLSDDWR